MTSTKHVTYTNLFGCHCLLLWGRNVYCKYILPHTRAQKLNWSFNARGRFWDNRPIVHPFSHAQTAAHKERKSVVQPRIPGRCSVKGTLCCHGEQHNASCCALCPVCDVYVCLSRWWQRHKSPVGLRQLTLLCSFRRGSYFDGASFFLHTGTAADVALGTRWVITMPLQAEEN